VSALEYAPSGGTAVDPSLRPMPGTTSSLDLPEALLQAASQLTNLRCAGCGYGACCRTVPERCPMCQLSAWEHEAWRPFSRARFDD
jgi:hypothetical protein